MSKLFQPSQSQIKSSNLSAYEKFLNQSYKKQFKNYSQLWNWSVKNPRDFWKSITDFYKVPLYEKKNAKLIQKNSQFWKTNFFFNYQTNYFCLLEKNKSNDLAIHFIGENKYEEKITYQELNQRVNALSSYYRSIKIKVGDVIVGYLPNLADTVIAFLAAAKIGAVWSSCSSDFGSKAVIDRFSQLKPKLMVVADHYFYNGKKFNYSKNLRQIQKKIGNPKILKTNYPCKNNNSALHKIYNNKKFQLSEMTEIVDFNHPLYVLFSSGTTGLPKCITHGHGGSLLQHLKELSLHTDVKPKDKMLFLTTCGWMMWNWTVSNLLLGSSITLYDGSPFYPNKDRVTQLTKKSKSNILGAGAKIYEAIQNNHRSSKKNLLPDLKCFISTGSPLSKSTFQFINRTLNKKSFIHSISGGTDIVSCFMLGVPTLPVYAGEIQGPGLGMNIDVFNEKGKPTTLTGELVCKTPFPSKPIYFWNDKNFKKYQSAYFEKFNNIWSHGDFVKKTKNGGYIIYGRSDATLNPGGVRIGTGEIYSALQNFPWIDDSLATGYLMDNDEKVILFIKSVKNKVPSNYTDLIKKHLKSTLSPRHVPWKTLIVKDIPRTKSGKNSEILVKNIINNDKVQNLGALANPESVEEFRKIKIDE
jgi:acetoacetyl-CoA synthetase